MQALRQIDAWPAATAAAGVVAGGSTSTRGPAERALPWASVTKIATALAVLVAAEEGTIELDEPAGPPPSTVRHLLAHASGLAPDERTAIARPGHRRIYSNAGFEVVAELVGERAEMTFADYLREAVLEPLAVPGRLHGSPASGLVGSLGDLLRLGRELLAPTLIAPETLREATEVQFPGLSGVLPGFGRMEPNDWGLGVELRDEKDPHWTGRRNSPRTFGHFGRSGTFLWVDPVAGVALGCLTDLLFDDWAMTAWPRLSDAVLEEAAARPSADG